MKEHMRSIDLKKKTGEYLMGIGLLIFMFFACAIDGPGNNMRVVYGGIGTGMTLAIIGATMADAWQ